MALIIRLGANINVRGGEQLVSASTRVQDLRREMSGLQTAFMDACEKFNHVGFAMANASSAIGSIAGTLNNLTAESRSFGGAMAAANTMAGKGGEDFAKLKDQVAELSKTIPIARDQLANGLYQVISNGVPEGNWLEYLEKSAKASVGGIANLEEVVKVTSTVIKNYGLQWSEAGDIQDKIQLTAKNGSTSFEQMAQALPRVTANAATLGVSVDELMASFATLTGVSGNTAEVSTQLAAIFTALIKPSSEATKMAQQMGIQFDAAAIKAAGGMKNFITQLSSDVKSYAASSGMLEQEIYGKLFGSAESLRALTPLTGNLADKFAENVNAMQDSAGTIDEAFKTMGNTGGAQLQKLKNSFGELTDVIQSSIGGVLPYINFGSQALVSLNAVISLTAAVKNLSLVHKAASVATTAYGVVSANASRMVTGLRTALTGATAAATAARVAIASLMTATVVGAAITLLSTALGELSKAETDTAATSSALKDAEETYIQTAASTKASIDAEAKKLGDLMKAHQSTAAEVAHLNQTYGSIFGSHQTAAAWYDTLTKKSQVYARQLGYEAQVRVLASKLAEKQIQLQDNYDKRRDLWKQGGAVKTITLKMSPGMDDVTHQQDTEAYSSLKEEARGLLPEIKELQRQLGIAETKMKECAKEVRAVDASGKKNNQTLKVSALNYTDVKKKIEEYQDKLGAATNDTKEANRLNGILKQLKARKAALEKTYSGLSTSNKNKTGKEPKFYKNPKTAHELDTNINYYSKKLTGKDTEEQRQLIKSIQLWKDKRAEIELTQKAALVPTEIKTSQDVDTTLDYLNTKKKYAKEGDVADINRQISKTELAGLALERPKSVSAQSTDEEINKEIAYQQKLKETTEGSTEAIDKEIERLGRLKDRRTEVQKLQDALDEAMDNYDRATTVEAKVKAVTDIHELQAEIDAKSKEKLTLEAGVTNVKASMGDKEAKRTVYSDAEQKVSQIQQDKQMGIIDTKEAKRQIKEINDALIQLGMEPIKVEVDSKEAMEAIGQLGSVSISSFDSVRQNLETLSSLPTSTAKGFAMAGDSAVMLGQAMQQLGSDSEAAKAGMVMAAIGQIALSFAQAMASASSNWITWLAFGIAGTAQMISMIATISQFATGGIVGGSSTSGDKVPVRVNSGEMILNKTQQARLFAIANGDMKPNMNLRSYELPQLRLNTQALGEMNRQGSETQTVKFRLEGRNLVGALANETRINGKSGKRSNIRV